MKLLSSRPILTLAAVFVPVVSFSADAYRLTDLGAFVSFANDINDSSLILGNQSRTNLGPGAVFYSGGQAQYLDQASAYVQTTGIALNFSGQATGQLRTTNLAPGHAFRFSGGVFEDLGTLGGDWSTGVGINASGQVVGNSDLPGNTAKRAFLSSGGTMQNLGVLPGDKNSYATDINDAGQVALYSERANGLGRAAIYSNGVLTSIAENYIASSADAINNLGQVTGQVVSGTRGLAYVYSGGAINIINPIGLDDLGRDINDLGVVVGSYRTEISANAISRAFVTQNGAAVDLTKLLDSSGQGWILREANAINNLGQIVGYGQFNGVEFRAYLLTPTAVPEPGTFVALGLGAVALLRRRKK